MYCRRCRGRDDLQAVKYVRGTAYGEKRSLTQYAVLHTSCVLHDNGTFFSGALSKESRLKAKTMQDVEWELVTRAGRGDMGAFREIYQRVSGYVYTLAYRVVNTKHDAEEVTQDVFLKLHQSLGSFKFESSFKTWLYRIAVNTALNHAKKRSRVTTREVEEIFEDPAVVTQPDATKSIAAGETENQLKILLDQLNPDQRACIVLREIEGLNYQGIATSLGININTVRSRLKRARETLMSLGQEEVASHGM